VQSEACKIYGATCRYCLTGINSGKASTAMSNGQRGEMFEALKQWKKIHRRKASSSWVYR